MFATPTGQPHRNSNFGRRALRPAVDGTFHRPQAAVRLDPVRPGLTFHGLRHGQDAGGAHLVDRHLLVGVALVVRARLKVYFMLIIGFSRMCTASAPNVCAARQAGLHG